MSKSSAHPSGPAFAAGAVLVALLLSAFNITVSSSGTALALPRVGSDLHATGPDLAWLFNAYNLTFAACTLVFGSLSDQLSRRRMFLLGAALFGVGCAVTAVAHDILIVSGGRAVEGVGAAAMLTSGMAIMSTTFDGAARVRAFAAYAATLGAGIACGPVLSGRMVDALGWRVSFLCYALTQVVVVIAALAIRSDRAVVRVSIDRAGIVTYTLGVGLLMYGIIQVPDHGWLSWQGGGLFLVGVVLLGGFLRASTRRRHPLLSIDLLRNRTFMTWSLATVLTSVGFLPVLSLLPTYLQSANRLSPTAAGNVMLAMTGPVLIVALVTGWLITHGVSARALITTALLSMGVGSALLSMLRSSDIHPVSLTGMALIGLGMGVSFAIAAAQALHAVEPAKAGMASGLFNAMRTSTEALIVAVFSTLLLILMSRGLGSLEIAKQTSAGVLDGPNRADRVVALTDSWQMLLWCTATLCTLGALAVHRLLRSDSGQPADAAMLGTAATPNA